jgi:AbrB family looped-hinge helix DNA binding protein
MTILSKVTRHGQITLPAAVRKELDIQEGDIVEIQVVDDCAMVIPKKLVDKSQSYFWTEEWQKGEAEAEADIKAGRIEAFDSVEQLLEDLDR